MPLPVADSWFKATKIDEDTTLIIEPHIHVLEQANMWLVEGSERDVIAGGNWARHRPLVVLVEATRPLTTTPAWEAWEPLLVEAGYRFVLFDGLNRFYVREEDADLERHFRSPANVLDDFVPYREHELRRRYRRLRRRARARRWTRWIPGF